MANKNGGIANLIKNDTRTPEQRREAARKAGIASGVAKRKRKTMRETLIELLSLPMKKGEMKSGVTSIAEFKDANISLNDRIVLTMAYKAAKGDVKAATFVRDTIGEMPVQEVKMEQSEATRLSDEELRKIVNGEV